MHYIGHQITQLIIDIYFNKDLFTQTNNMIGLHAAAAWANLTALNMVKECLEKLKRLNPDLGLTFADLANTVDEDGRTVLDCVIPNFTLDENAIVIVENQFFSQTYIKDQRNSAALKCYTMLRELGAVHRIELDGFPLR